MAQVLCVGHPVEALQRADLRLHRHHAEDARIEIPAEVGGDHVARALGQFLHHRACAGRVVLDVLAQFDQIGPGLVPALVGVHRILVAQYIGQPLQEGPPGPGVGRPGVEELLRMRLGPVQQFLRRLWRLLHRVRHVFDDRAGGTEHHAHRLVLRQGLHFQRTGQIDLRQLRQLGRVVGHQRHPQLLVDARGQAVGAGQHQIDIDPAGILLRLELPRQLGRGRLGERDLRHQLRIGLRVLFHGPLGQLQLPRHVDDVQHDRCGRQYRRGRGARTAQAQCRRPRRPGQQRPASGCREVHGRFPVNSSQPAPHVNLTSQG